MLVLGPMTLILNSGQFVNININNGTWIMKFKNLSSRDLTENNEGGGAFYFLLAGSYSFLAPFDEK